MKRWIVIVGCVALLMIVFVVRLVAPVASEETKPAIIGDPDALQVMNEAMEAMGYRQKGLVGKDWGVARCDVHTYLISPADRNASAFFAVKSKTSGKMWLMSAAQFEEALKRHVTYEGTMTLSLGDNGNGYSLLGSMPDGDGDLVFVYARYDKTACGLVVDEVMYWTPRRTEKVTLNLQLLP